VNNESTRDFLRNNMEEFQGFIARVYTVLPRTTKTCVWGRAARLCLVLTGSLVSERV
jgi:hypothetical protein